MRSGIALEARHRGDDFSLQWSKAEQLRTGDHVIRVPVQAHGIDVHSHFIQHGRGGNPRAAIPAQAMDAPGLVKESERQLAHLLRVFQVHAVTPAGIQQHVLPVGFQLPVRTRVLVILSGHLRQNSVTQSQRGVAKALSPQACSRCA